MTTPRPYIYQTGTADVTLNSVNVVGHGTAWLAVDYSDQFWMLGFGVPVLEVIDDTHLTLALPWPGTTQSGHTYAITAGISSTDSRRYGWLIATSFAVLEQIPADAQQARDAAVAAAADANTYKLAASASAALAQGWAATAHNTDVTTPGTRSALHYSVEASSSATASATSATSSSNFAQLASDWASKAQNTDVTSAGSRSAMHWALTAAASVNTAVAAAIALATAWASQPFGQDVAGATAGSRSALHYATASANSASAAAISVQTAADWSSKGIGLDVTSPGTRSAFHWSDVSHTWANASSSSATAAAASASAAAASAALLANPDFGFITDAATDFQDFGTIT
jgi:hypothetical protein